MESNWIHDLVKAEIHPDAEKLLQLGKEFDPQQRVEESTVEFLTELKARFTEYARIFNAYSENSARFQEIKIYSLAQTAADFMIYRNQIKLVVANVAHGVVQLSFSHHTRTTLMVDGQTHGAGAVANPNFPAAPHAQELLAQVGPFRDVHWTFQGEKISAEQVAQFYFAEFVRASREGKRTRSGNELLLQQIKALLEEKGLDL